MFEQDLYRTLARNLPGFGIFIYDVDLRYVMAVGDDILGSVDLIPADVIGQPVDQVPFPGPAESLERHFKAALKGEVIDFEVTREGRSFALRFAPIRSESGRVQAGLMTCHDVTETVRAREAMRALSLTDELTGIYNRRGFAVLADQQLKVLDRSSSGALLFFVDLNDLKIINDGVGHDAGDDALRATSALLTSTFRDSDIIARYGGDEFVVFTTDVGKDMDPVFRQRLKEAVGEFNRTSRFKLSLSVGSSYYDPEDPETLDHLISEADKNMYGRKKQWKLYGSSGTLPAVRESQFPRKA